MAGNSFGTVFRVSSFGESHGPGIGCVVDGVPPGIPLTEADLQIWLDRRKPGQSRHTTQRKEPDTVEILSGVFEGQTTGTAIGLLIRNQDQRSKDYSDIQDKFRPGHADFTYWAKYHGIRDYRGGGRASARETATRVAAGAIARKILEHDIPAEIAQVLTPGEALPPRTALPPPRIRGALVQIGDQTLTPGSWDWDHVEQNPFWCPDPKTTASWEALMDRTRKAGSSIGAVIQVEAEGLPPGLGEPVFDRLDADLAKALMSINAVKSVEIGAGLQAANLSGEDNADEMSIDDEGRLHFSSNNAGGILGGISTGQTIIARFAVKPTSSILTARKTLTKTGADADVITKGRHDPCVGIRAVPVGEAMMACVLADHWLRFKAQCLGAYAHKP